MKQLPPWLTGLAWHLLPPVGFYLGMSFTFPFWDEIWLSFDEGFNLVKAMLVEHGYPLYTQVWSDQPPIWTHLLATLFRWNGDSVYAARRVELIASCLLLWAAIQFARQVGGNRSGIACALIVILLPKFPVYSAAVLVGQPSLAFGMLSIYLAAMWFRQRRWIWLVASALALDISIFTKLFTGVLVPVLALWILASECIFSNARTPLRNRIIPLLIWSGVFAAGCGIVTALWVGPAGWVQLVAPVFQAARAVEAPANEQIHSINFYLVESWPILLAALVGTFIAVRRRIWLYMLPMGWGLLAYGFLLFHSPVWLHHHFLVTLPAAQLAALAIGEGLAVFSRKTGEEPGILRLTWTRAAGLALFLIVLGARLPVLVETMSPGADRPSLGERRAPSELRLLTRINRHSTETRWMVTDLPMYAFRAGILVPPELAVVSWKRFAAGELAESDLLDAVQKYQPEQVLIGRFDLPVLETSLEKDYRIIYEHERIRLYLRRDVGED